MLMIELGVTKKKLDVNDKVERDLTILKKRNESTALNIYHLKVEQEPKTRPKYKNPVKNIQKRVDQLL